MFGGRDFFFWGGGILEDLRYFYFFGGGLIRGFTVKKLGFGKRRSQKIVCLSVGNLVKANTSENLFILENGRTLKK